MEFTFLETTLILLAEASRISPCQAVYGKYYVRRATPYFTNTVFYNIFYTMYKRGGGNGSDFFSPFFLPLREDEGQIPSFNYIIVMVAPCAGVI